MDDTDLKNKLMSEQYHVMREKGTEAPFSGKYVNEHAKGTYKCAACGAQLFSSDVSHLQKLRFASRLCLQRRFFAGSEKVLHQF